MVAAVRRLREWLGAIRAAMRPRWIVEERRREQRRQRTEIERAARQRL